ncbi:MAG TPA: translation initiation factor [Vicinamibacteria bacterium]|nr:translation initiation factor [Vicinamibacteria bacterium]
MARERDTRLVYSTGGETEPAATGPPGPGAGRPGRGASPPGIRLRLERRASDRVVTSICGLPGPSAELAALARSLKSACGAGGTVKDGVVELQGDHRQAVEAFLAARGLKSRRAGG